jgi:hypothetical protein
VTNEPLPVEHILEVVKSLDWVQAQLAATELDRFVRRSIFTAAHKLHMANQMKNERPSPSDTQISGLARDSLHNRIHSSSSSSSSSHHRSTSIPRSDHDHGGDPPPQNTTGHGLTGRRGAPEPTTTAQAPAPQEYRGRDVPLVRHDSDTPLIRETQTE